MDNWRSKLKYDPLPALMASGNQALIFCVEKCLLGKAGNDKAGIWNLPDARKIVGKQQKNGSWKYPGGNKNIRSQENYDQIETFRNLGYLVEMYHFDNTHYAIRNAADFIFSCQTKEGDIRGILGNQYTPYYTAGMMELLIKAGYANNVHIEKGFMWLASIRQNDGGWAIPLRTLNKKLDVITMGHETLEPDRSKPFSHLVTGVVLRAYAAHERYRHIQEAKEAGKLLLSHLFKKDAYPDRGSADYWYKFTFPFWFTDLISAMDSLSLLGFSKDEPQMAKAINWFIANQEKDGLWDLYTLKNKKYYETSLWLSLAICRIMKRLYNN